MLVVVTIFALLASVGVIQILRARIVTYEQLALTSMRHIARSCQFYFLTNQAYPGNLTALGTPASDPPYLNADLIGDGTTVDKQGYTFTYAQGAGGTGFTLLADPQSPGVTGSRHFYIDQDAVIHVDPTGSADSTDPVLP